MPVASSGQRLWLITGTRYRHDIQHSAVFKLPDDVLIAIFTEVKNTNGWGLHSFVLCQVCRRWRTVARGAAGLWTTIDLSRAKKAKAFLSLSKDAPLVIICQLYKEERLNDLDCIWPNSHRFVKLSLSGSRWVVRRVMDSIGEDLPMLRILSIHGDPLSTETPLLAGFPTRFSNLVHLRLW